MFEKKHVETKKTTVALSKEMAGTHSNPLVYDHLPHCNGHTSGVYYGICHVQTDPVMESSGSNNEVWSKLAIRISSHTRGPPNR